MKVYSCIFVFCMVDLEMVKNIHEIRDPIHVFIKLDSDERKVLDSRPFQRLRYIRQLATTYLLYPGATHSRFEHSLGVMELASRVFDVVTHKENIHKKIWDLFPEISTENNLVYWRRVLRMAALCHDIGHLPFSHAAEEELLPAGWDHERFTRELILSPEMETVWRRLTPPLRPEDIVKLSVGPKGAHDLNFSDWEAILSEIIVGDAFGVDRMDYLLRDSYYAGVAYGRFDHHRLVETVRILPPPPENDQNSDHTSIEPSLGIEEGGLQAAEALLLARYFMFSQVYLHRVRRIYDIHLKDFLTAWLPGNKFSTELESHLKMTDNEVLTAMREISRNPEHQGFEQAKRFIERNHFKTLYERNPEDLNINPEAGLCIYTEAVEKFGEENVRFDRYKKRGGAPDFPVLAMDRRINSSLVMSKAFESFPEISIDYVFVDRSILKEARGWLKKNLRDIIAVSKEE